jgi:hypothetical protein
MAGRPDFESVQAETWWLRSHVSSEEDPMPESQWKPRGVAGQPRGWLSGHPFPPNQPTKSVETPLSPYISPPTAEESVTHTHFVVLHL